MTATQLPEGAIARSWAEAQALWDVVVSLSPPEPIGAPGKPYQGNDPLAYIDLETRQVRVDLARLESMGAAGSLTAVLAHELGHHVRFPHTLGLAAELQTLERRLVPLLSQSLTNLFFDLQVNEVVGRTHAEELCAVYRGFLRAEGRCPPLFGYYLAVYEELWALPAGALVPARDAAAMEKQFPGFRADARLFAQTFWAEDDVHLQFIYFLGRFIRYLPDPSKADLRFVLAQDVAAPSEDDFDRHSVPSDLLERALDEAVGRGWIDERDRTRVRGEEGAEAVKNVSASAPGTAQQGFKKGVAARYRALVERHLIEPPPVPMEPEPYLPTVAEEWEPGDGPRAIDWTQSILTRGPLAAVVPLKRALDPDEPPHRDSGLPAVEIYLDTSGSMPDPDTHVNAMTLAAQVLATSAIRKGGVVRGIIYSMDWRMSDWLYHEDVARDFFMLYSGGGTSFPFPLLRRLARERHDVIRVVISDSDFLHNVAADADAGRPVTKALQGFPGPKAISALEYGVRKSRLFVAMLSLPGGATTHVQKTLGRAASHPHFRLVAVRKPGDLSRAAADLARAILD